MESIYYKVCRRECGESVSAGAVEYTYSRRTWNYPKYEHSKLFVFETLDDARDFVSLRTSGYKFAIYSCVVRNPKKAKVLCGSGDSWSIIRFWDRRHKKKPLCVARMAAPRGTIACDAVLLVDYLGTYDGQN